MKVSTKVKYTATLLLREQVESYYPDKSLLSWLLKTSEYQDLPDVGERITLIISFLLSR